MDRTYSKLVNDLLVRRRQLVEVLQDTDTRRFHDQISAEYRLFFDRAVNWEITDIDERLIDLYYDYKKE